MAEAAPLRIDTFSDLLCVWACAAARTIPELWGAIARLIEAFTPIEGRHSFAAAGYRPERSENALIANGLPA